VFEADGEAIEKVSAALSKAGYKARNVKWAQQDDLVKTGLEIGIVRELLAAIRCLL